MTSLHLERRLWSDISAAEIMTWNLDIMHVLSREPTRCCRRNDHEETMRKILMKIFAIVLLATSVYAGAASARGGGRRDDARHQLHRHAEIPSHAGLPRAK